MSGAQSCLGAVIAGGRSQRFGSDKAIARIDGQRMIDRVIAALSPQVDAMVICGRQWPGIPTLADYPVAGFGPLGGLCAALRHARKEGFGAVLSVPVDVVPLPLNMRDLLTGDKAAVFEHQYLVGYWPTHYAEPLESHIQSNGRRAFRAWLDLADVRYVAEPFPMHNVNFADELPKEI